MANPAAITINDCKANSAINQPTAQAIDTDGVVPIEDGGDMWPSRPILFKLFPEDQAKYDAKMKAAAEAYAAETTQKGPAR